MIQVEVKGDYSTTLKWLRKLQDGTLNLQLAEFGRRGAAALASATPVDTGRTASQWTYEIRQDKRGFEIIWHNTNINRGANIAILLQYGHGQHGGGYVQGKDYINPAIRPVFDQIAAEAWKAVNSA